ncbi:helix-turn-helix domain-containing protein [Candidatus Enterococcus murrayae]|uniref:Helix-turn-helix domain-containing protein n=1 Tax=Candidatus Enterococcus murrayae TaxID=2815321 RepID=A0ABS3HL14_9ENTE|nr:helix-turn-helix domain-containing protein [Enterococcus sp. MJM16]MBO0454136.1 helix-turn-helix domain-containing protein [Enterococcus sp. MJM16]
MLERYIEKNIFRQVYLCQQLYQKKEIDLQTMAERLKVCTITINNDLLVLNELFNQEITTFKKNRNICKVSFDPTYPLLELTQRIYRRSDFLRVLNDFLIGNTHWSEIAEKEFLSTSKIYQIRANIFSFSEELGCLQQNHSFAFSEKDLRNLFLAIARYTGDRSAIPFNKVIAAAAEKLIDYVEEHFFARYYPTNERELIILGIQLSNQRARHFPILFSEKEKASARQTPLFKLLREGIKNLDSTICANEDELFYIYSLFNARNYLCNNLELLQKDFEVVYQNHIQRYPAIEELLQELRFSLNISPENELLLKKAFLPFIRSTWADMQLFQPDLIYLLDKEQQTLYQTIQTILEKWSAACQTTIHWNTNLIRKMTLILDLLLRNTFDEKIELYIVAPSDFNFLYYRKQLESLLDDHFVISNMIYNTLNEVVDDVFFCSKRVIVCDTALYQTDLGSENTLIFPVSLKTIDETCNEINQIVRPNEKGLKE